MESFYNILHPKYINKLNGDGLFLGLPVYLSSYTVWDVFRIRHRILWRSPKILPRETGLNWEPVSFVIWK